MDVGRGNQQSPATALPLGLQSIYAACRRIYPDQHNPLQVSALVKYWLGGPDPLDYISMYANPGDPKNGVPAHWHYISLGLSDLHGDGRVHECTGPDTPSGFGFELTFRLKREPTEMAPPTWPAELMQGLARYFFQSENSLCSGDHVSWHNSLDNSGDSRLKHMLMYEDPQLSLIYTPFGSLQFIQIVGICEEELQAVQKWNGLGIIDLLKKIPLAGGPWLVTNMRRGETVFEMDPQLQEEVERGIQSEGSNLSGVSAKCAWAEVDSVQLLALGSQGHGGGPHPPPTITKSESEQIKQTLERGLAYDRAMPLPPIHPKNRRESNDTIEDGLFNRKTSVDSLATESTMELMKTQMFDGIHLKFNREAGKLLPLALRGRIRHGRHFTFRSVVGDTIITLVSVGVEGAIADESHPYAAHGPWLHVLISDDFVSEMELDLQELDSSANIELPRHYKWPHKNLAISIYPEEHFLQ